MTDGYAVQKHDDPHGAVVYTVTRLDREPARLVDALLDSPEALTAIATLILRDLGQFPTDADADEFVSLEFAPLKDRPYGVRIVAASKIERWLDARGRAAAAVNF